MNMKRKTLFFLTGFLLLTTTLHAQKWSFDNKSDSKQNWFGIDLGVGSMKDINGTGIDFGLRYLRSYSSYIAWNVINVKAIANTEDFEKTITPQVMTGIKLTSPKVLKDISIFGGFKGGYGYNIDSDKGGFCYEIEAGLNLTRNIFIGYAYNNQKISEGNIKYSAFRIGFNL